MEKELKFNDAEIVDIILWLTEYSHILMITGNEDQSYYIWQMVQKIQNQMRPKANINYNNITKKEPNNENAE